MDPKKQPSEDQKEPQGKLKETAPNKEQQPPVNTDAQKPADQPAATEPTAGKTIELSGTENPQSDLNKTRQVTGLPDESLDRDFVLEPIAAEKVAKGPIKMKYIAKRGLHLTKAQATAMLPHISYISQHGSSEGEVILFDEEKFGE